MKHVINMAILALVFVTVTPVIAQTMDKREALFNGMTEQQKKAGLLVVHDYLRNRLIEQSVKSNNPEELSRTMSIGAYTSVLQYELTNKLGWDSLAMYHKTEARVTLAYLLGDIKHDLYQKLAMKNKGYFDKIQAEADEQAFAMGQLPSERKKDMERVGNMIYEESVRIADEAKAARDGKKPT